MEFQWSEKDPDMMAIYVVGKRMAAIFVLISLTFGCVAAPDKFSRDAKAEKSERREMVMPKSNLGATPKGTGLDSRARAIESSLGIPGR